MSYVMNTKVSVDYTQMSHSWWTGWLMQLAAAAMSTWSHWTAAPPTSARVSPQAVPTTSRDSAAAMSTGSHWSTAPRTVAAVSCCYIACNAQYQCWLQLLSVMCTRVPWTVSLPQSSFVRSCTVGVYLSPFYLSKKSILGRRKCRDTTRAPNNVN